jgi:predicted nucleic acid-binding Zn ribbon protein
MKKHYILTHQGEIKKVTDLFSEKCIMASNKKRHLRKRLTWYLKNGFILELKDIKEE